MGVLVYLDQNILSDLRKRKIFESQSKLNELLKLTLQSEAIEVVYSHVTLKEINQIKSETYRNEHIEVLSELNARYIEPLSKTLIKQEPKSIWSTYLENQQDHRELGTLDFFEIAELTSRKISGLPISESFDEINNQLKRSLEMFLLNCGRDLNSFDKKQLNEDEIRSVEELQQQLLQLNSKVTSLQAITLDETKLLGPKPYRESEEIKNLELHNLEPHLVVSAIESLYKTKNSEFNLASLSEGNSQNAVAIAYGLLNWAGYYADDFTRIKKNSDRFNASNNDLQHATSALGTDFLISNDEAFVKKSEACFAFVGSKTIPCTPLTFINKYCNFV